MAGMEKSRPFTDILTKLRAAGLRPTRQRLALGKTLFEGPDRHVTAEQVHREVTGVSLATVYNGLHQFAAAGLLRAVVIAPGRAFYDTNISDHHHIYDEDQDRLEDLPAQAVEISRLPDPPAGKRITQVDVVVRLSNLKSTNRLGRT